MFVPEDFDPDAKRVYLRFTARGECDLLIEGVRILRLKGDRIYLSKFVSGSLTGLSTGANGEAIVEIEE